MSKQETDPAMLWDTIESTQKIKTISKVESVMKMAARAMYQQMWQGAYKMIITYKESKVILQWMTKTLQWFF